MHGKNLLPAQNLCKAELHLSRENFLFLENTDFLHIHSGLQHFLELKIEKGCNLCELCSNSITNCTECSNSNFCYNCSNGYYPDENGKCQTCDNITGCSECLTTNKT